jgi:hypothetical protein
MAGIPALNLCTARAVAGVRERPTGARVSRAMRRCSPVSFTKVAVAWLESFTSGSANHPLDDAHNLPDVPPPTPAVRTERALRSAPVVLVRGVRMPAYADTGTSIVVKHSPNFPFTSVVRPAEIVDLVRRVTVT